MYFVVDAAGRVDSTYLVDGWPQQVDARRRAEQIGGCVAVVPVIHDFRPDPQADP